jgi:putative FmdB family regulatory protein
MSTAQAASRQKNRCLGLRGVHQLILNGVDGEGRRQRSWTMPIFEYICNDCNHQFEALVYGKQKAACPKCHGDKLAPQLSVFAVSAKGGSTTASSGSACGACGDPRGPGACSLPDLN